VTYIATRIRTRTRGRCWLCSTSCVAAKLVSARKSSSSRELTCQRRRRQQIVRARLSTRQLAPRPAAAVAPISAAIRRRCRSPLLFGSVAGHLSCACQIPSPLADTISRNAASNYGIVSTNARDRFSAAWYFVNARLVALAR